MSSRGGSIPQETVGGLSPCAPLWVARSAPNVMQLVDGHKSHNVYLGSVYRALESFGGQKHSICSSQIILPQARRAAAAHRLTVAW